MESRRVYLCFLLFLISSVFSAIDHTGLEDGSSLEWSIVNKVKASEEASLVANGKFEYFLQPFTDDGTKTSDGYADSEYDWAPAFAIDQSSCSKDQYNTIVKAGKPKPAVRSWAMHYIQYTPTQDIELIVELTRYNLNQTYSPKLQIVSFLNNGYTDVNRTPADDASIKYEDSMYCGGTIMDLCTNSDSPLSFVFLKGLTYLFQIYAGNLNNTGTLNPNITVGKFYLGLTVANQIWIEDFNNVSVGSLPTGWVASINPTTAPTRNPNSTWVVGDIAYLDGTRTDEGSGNVYGVYLPIDMDPAGGVTFIKNFLGFNPNIRCNDTSYCKRVNESVVTGPIDLTSFTNGLIFQFSATLDNSYRPTGSSTATDWTATLYYSLDDGATWPESQKLLGGNFPLISTLTNHATQWLTYQYNANAVAGKVFRLKFVLDQKAASTTRYFGIDNIRFITNNHHKTCMLPFTCANPSCPVAFNYTLTAANPQGYQGCGYAPVNSRCSTALSNECTDAFCRPDLIVGGTADSTTGCAVVTNVSRCTAGASCETPSCSATSGCSYSQDDSLCASGASPCADYYCDTTAHKGCQYNYTLSSTDVAKHHDPRIVCNDNAACTSDVCRPLGYTTSGSDNYDSTTGCTHSTIANYCDTNNGTFGSTECSVSTCDPAAAAAAIDNQAPAGSGCYSKPVDSLCTQGSDCDHVSCSFSTGCVYNGDASLCTAHTQCITPTCISKQGAGNGCDYSDNTTNIALCSDSFSCTDDFCTNVGSTTDSGCVHLARNDICVPGNSSSIYGNAECVTSACDPTNPSAEVGTGCFSTKHDDMCDDYSRECESNSCDFNAGCQYTPNHSICQAKTGDCINAVCEHGKTTGGCDFTDNTTKLESTCSGGSECQVTSCQHVPHPLTSGFDNGCRYESVDSICQAKTTNCTNAICDGFNGCDYSDVTTNVGMCDDGYACTEDYCTSDLSAPLTSGCHNDAQDSYCALSAAGATCADSVCAPSSSTDSTGCEITEHDDRCTSDSLCADAKCSNVTGCSYTANDDFCALLGPKCNIYTCYLVNYKSSYDPTEWSQKDANGCFAKHNCSDGIACTVDVCQANDMCKNTADNSKCQQSQGCTENICAPSNSSSDPDGCIYYSRCDDKIDCTRDECVNTTAGRDKCLHTVDMKLCDDHVDCTYELLCDVNAVHYDSGIPSIVKSYDNITGCIRVPMNEWCDDGLPCTIDVCQPTNSTQTGGCVHWPIDCDDGIPCTVDSCDELTGNCKHEDDPDYCNDDIICTIDKCDHALGMCTNIPDDTECSAFSPDKCHDAYCRPSMTSGSDGCFFLERSCNDGIACTDDSCDALTGACSHQANNTHCDDGGECTDDRCDDVLGKCVNIPNSDHCNDGLPCTVDFCDCETGNCVHTAVDCSDEIACTVDSCNNTDGRCTHTPQADLCDDGVLCTDDICNTELGRCVNVKNDLFCETLHSDNKSVNWACQPPSVLTVYSDPHIDGCVAVAKNCDDDILCTYDYADPVTGICSHTPFDNLCNDGSECNDYSCSTTLGCIAKPNDTKCDDNLNCTVDSCGCDGKCEHKQLYCNDEIACTDDSCNEALGGVCVYTANNVSCDDSIDCTFDTCDLVRGCSNIPHDEVCGSTECSFGVCVIGYGGCQYELHDELCDDRIQCTMDYCDPVNGTCAHVTQDGLCDDGIPCTSDVCTPDGCVYTPNDDWCDDGVSCTDNICSTEYGCQYVPVVSRCDDNLNCTLDTCDEVLDCIHTAQNALCSDGISCTLDVCNTTLGACTNTAMDSYCSDDFNCTTESCDASADAGTTGCVIDVSNCTWANPQLLWLDTQSAKAQILEKRTSDGSSMDFLTSDQNGELLPRISFTADNKVIFGGNQQTTRLSDGDGVVMNYPLRLVPVTEDSLGECNEIRRGTIAVAEIITPCGDRMCNSDTVVVCMLGAKYEWMKFSP